MAFPLVLFGLACHGRVECGDIPEYVLECVSSLLFVPSCVLILDVSVWRLYVSAALVFSLVDTVSVVIPSVDCSTGLPCCLVHSAILIPTQVRPVCGGFRVDARVASLLLVCFEQLLWKGDGVSALASTMQVAKALGKRASLFEGLNSPVRSSLSLLCVPNSVEAVQRCDGCLECRSTHVMSALLRHHVMLVPKYGCVNETWLLSEFYAWRLRKFITCSFVGYGFRVGTTVPHI